MQYFYGMLWLTVVHFIADFVLQSDWMAQNKSKDNRALGLHVTAYTSALAIGSIPLVFILGYGSHPAIGPVTAIWVIANGGAHFVTDFITSRINSRLWAAKEVHWFFVGIGADQVIHYLTLGLTMVWILS